MEKSFRIRTKDLPDCLRAALKEVEYGAQDISVEISSTISALSQGGQGSRGFTLVVELSTGRFTKRLGSWGGASVEMKQVDFDDRETPLLEGFAVIKGTMGFPRTIATINVNPVNMVKFLPEPCLITERQKGILRAFSSLTSAGRKDEWARDPVNAPTVEELDELVKLKLLSRSSNGATKITVEGKNAL